MTQDEMDAALERLVEMISEGASPDEAATEAVRIVADWQRWAHVEAFQFNIRGVLTEMEKSMPMIRNLERIGPEMSITVEDGESTSFNVPLEGVADSVRAIMAALRAARNALDGVRVKRTGLTVLDGGKKD